MVLNRRQRGSNLGVLLLGSQLMNFGLQHIPPATLALIVGQGAIFLDLLPQLFRSANSVCVSSYLVIQTRDWRRLILAQFYHGDDMHLYFNMVSLLYKGTFLERKFGTPYFVYLTAVFTVLTGATYVGLGAVLSQTLDEQSYLTSCAVGFSGVLFAMKVLTTHYLPDGTHYALGSIPVPSKYIFWAELVLIQMMAPNASFVGHLAGILVGLAYVKGPLKYIMNAFLTPEDNPYTRSRRRSNSSSSDEGSSTPGSFTSIFTRRSNTAQPGSYSSHRFHQSGSTSGRPGPMYPRYQGYGGASGSVPSAPPMTDMPGHVGFESFNDNHQGYAAAQNPAYDGYTGGMDEDEQYKRAMEESLRDNKPQTRGHQGMYPDLDDLRSRRSNFYH